MGFCHGACATRRDFHDRYGYYDPAFRISMDFAVFMSAVARGAVMAKVPDLISDIEAPGNSSQRLERTLEDVYKRQALEAASTASPCRPCSE